MRLEEVIASGGGMVSIEDVEARMTSDGAAAVFDVMELIQVAMQLATHRAALGEVHLVVTDSSSMSCRARRIDAEEAVILVPLGILARVRALARRLLWHLGQDEPVVHMVGSALDVRDFPWELAPGLVPVLGQDASDGGAEYWEALARFDRRTEPDESLDAVANDVMCQCLLYLGLHELAHLSARHDTLLRLARTHDRSIPAHLGLDVLRRGVEVHADMLAAGNQMKLQMLAVKTAHLADEHPDVMFGRTSFAVTMLFAMYDTHRKTVYEYDDTAYPHPIIRYEFWDLAVSRIVEQVRPDLGEIAREHAKAGWLDCVQAFNALEFDCMGGTYGRPRPWLKGGTGRYVPITALKYGGASALQPRFEADHELYQEVERLASELSTGVDNPGDNSNACS